MAAEQSNLKIVTTRPRPILKHTKVVTTTPKQHQQQQHEFYQNDNNKIIDEKLILLSNKLKLLTNGNEARKLSNLNRMSIHIQQQHHHHQLHPHHHYHNKQTTAAVAVAPTVSTLHRVMYNCEINKEIIQMISQTTNEFFTRIENELKKGGDEPLSSTSSLCWSTHKKDFIPKLREFLINNKTNNDAKNAILCNFKQKNRLNKKNIMNFMHKYYFTLSEPELSQTNVEYKYDSNNNNNSNVQPHHHHSSKYTQLSKVNKCQYVRASQHQQRTMKHSHSIDITDSSSSSSSTSSLSSIEYDLSISNLFELAAKKESSSTNSNNNKYCSLIQAKKETKKFVRFADSLGLDLVSVKIIKDTAAIVTPCYQQQNSDCDAATVKCKSATTKQYLVLIPCFTLLSKYAYNYSNCKLIDYLFDNENKILKFLIRVKNMSTEKQVFVRITFNGWKSYADIGAIDSSATICLKNRKSTIVADRGGSSEFNNFNCILSINDYLAKQTTQIDNDCVFKIEFAICFKANSVEHWDNNNGANYVFQCFNPKNQFN